MKTDAAMPSITIRLDEDTAKEVDELAGIMDRSRSWIAGTALRRYLRDEKHWIDEIRAGIADHDRGEGIPHDEAMARLEAHLNALDAKAE